ncbi:hypothetical protein AZE42_03505 [Rhizopogon vesiculosus]|uniref:Uncharacterized protein n=1 Tax=Rhizopogon vesiculosus TaxID=180088 RepID=A0A1J8QJX7_9AGAM|nr:hypothetical protein AZE42_03505 [Rhizopogon vesiculosus]
MPANSSAKTELQGLELTNDLFAPLLNPIAAMQSAWNNYSINRLQTTTKKGTLISRSSEEGEEDEYEYDEDDMVWLRNSIKACVSKIEGEMELDAGTLQKCITILGDDVELDDEDVRMASWHYLSRCLIAAFC